MALTFKVYLPNALSSVRTLFFSVPARGLSEPLSILGLLLYHILLNSLLRPDLKLISLVPPSLPFLLYFANDIYIGDLVALLMSTMLPCRRCCSSFLFVPETRKQWVWV